MINNDMVSIRYGTPISGWMTSKLSFSELSAACHFSKTGKNLQKLVAGSKWATQSGWSVISWYFWHILLAVPEIDTLFDICCPSLPHFRHISRIHVLTCFTMPVFKHLQLSMTFVTGLDMKTLCCRWTGLLPKVWCQQYHIENFTMYIHWYCIHCTFRSFSRLQEYIKLKINDANNFISNTGTTHLMEKSPRRRTEDHKWLWAMAAFLTDNRGESTARGAQWFLYCFCAVGGSQNVNLISTQWGGDCPSRGGS